MGIYDRQTGSLIKLSSFPNGFVLNNTEGTTQLATTLTDNVIQNISTVVTLTKSEEEWGRLEYNYLWLTKADISTLDIVHFSSHSLLTLK